MTAATGWWRRRLEHACSVRALYRFIRQPFELECKGMQDDMCRCVIITPATLRFGEIHHCVPAIPPQ
jgi:hypothetical protein